MIGAPASWKVTLGVLLARKLEYYHFSVGDMFRLHIMPPIAGCPPHINKYVFQSEVVPEEVNLGHFGESTVPPMLLAYNCLARGDLIPLHIRMPVLATVI